MKIQQKIILMLLFSIFSYRAFATNYYTASPTATLAGNSGAVNANWTTNSDGLTGLTTVAIATGDNLVVLNGGIVTITATAAMSTTNLTINQGATVIHNNNATGASFNIVGLLTWNGTIKTLQGASGSNFFNANGDVVGTTAIYDTASTRGVYLGGDGLRILNLTQLSSSITTGSLSIGLQLGKSRSLTGDCKLYSPIVYSGNCTIDLAGYNLQVSSIKSGNAVRLIKGNASSNLTLSGSIGTTTNLSVIYFDPTAAVLNEFAIDNAYSIVAAQTGVTVGSNLTVNSLTFGAATGDKGTRILSVGGNFGLNNNGTMRVQAKGTNTPGTDYDQLSVTGTTSIGTSTTLKADYTNLYAPQAGAQFSFVKSTGTITGSFGTLQTPNGYTAAVSYPAGKVQYQVLTSPPPTPACSYIQTPDLPLVASNATVEAEIDTIINRFSDSYLGTAEPTTAALDAAVATYNALNVVITGYKISGNITNFNQTGFLKTFAQYLKFHPEDTDNIYTKALNTVWLVSDKVCKGTLALDFNQYDFRIFALPAILIPSIKDNSYVKSLFDNVLYLEGDFDYIWEPRRLAGGNVGYNLDYIGQTGVVTMAYVKWIGSADERFRFMTGFKRQMDKFNEYSVGTADGLKPDGSGFHHWSSYPSYMYDLNAEADIIYYLRQTSFEVNSASYLRLRDALMAQLIFTNDNTTRFFTMTGRKPEEIATTISRYSFRKMAVAGGSILGTGPSDPVMATLYTRLWGGYGPFGNSTIAPYNEGYFQFNHSMAGIYRKNGWLAVCKGFNDNMFGTETYPDANRFGRYQSYGAINVVYPGDALTGNGYEVTTWNWNYNPGTTVIRLPWDKLHAEKSNQDELQQKKFAGSLSFINKNSNYLKAVHGTYGMFAMDFQQKTGQGWGTTYSGENHNASFVFKKSVFSFDNMLICLGSNIGNNDAVNTTLTTLYQRKTTTGKENVNADNNSLQASTYDNSYTDTDNHWIVDNFDTGFYVFSGSGTIKLTRSDQQTPQHNIPIASQNISSNPTGNYAIGYIDHGTAPSNKGYEYVCMPQTTTTEMTNFNSQISAGNKPYTVLRKDSIAHIVEYKPTANANSIIGYAFFEALSGINNSGQLTGADYPCLVMSKYDTTQKTLQIAVSNPDIGFAYRANTPSVSKQINIKIKGTNWQIAEANAQASITDTANGETTIQFTTVHGLPVEISLSRIVTTQTISFGAIPTKINTDPAFDLTATASSGLPVSYSSSNTAVATVSGHTLTITGQGTSTITATQAGDELYAPATPVEQIIAINAIISPVADAHVRDGSVGNSNYGTSSAMPVKKDVTGSNNEIYLKFDLHNINNVNNAVLRLRSIYSNTGVASTTWQVYYVPTDSWSETGITWNNKPASGTLLATLTGNSAVYSEWNISNQVLSELAGDKVLSLRIVSTVANATTDKLFSSKEATNTSQRPQLVLTSGISPAPLMASIVNSKNCLVSSAQSEDDNITVRVYPNPVKDRIKVDLDKYKNGTDIELFSLYGKRLFQQKVTGSNAELNVSQLATGLYILKVFADNKTVATIKIIKVD